MDNKQRSDFYDFYISQDKSTIEQILNTFPASVIKFYSNNDYNLEALKEQKIWFSSPNYFNDPFDCAINADYDEVSYSIFKKKCSKILTNDAIEELLNMDEVKPALSFLMSKDIEKYKNNVKSLIDTVFVSCFSEPSNLTSLRMWGYYANSHKGFCLEYAMRDFYNISNIRELLPVFYSNNFSLHTKFKSKRDFRKCKLSLFFTKALEWDYEKEWRLLNVDKEYAGQSVSAK